MITSPAEAIRFAITSGAYTGWTGLPDPEGYDYFMCLALEKLFRSRDVSHDAYLAAQRAIYQRLGSEVTHLAKLFREQGRDVPCPSKDSPWARDMALKWFNDLADELDKSTAGVEASTTNEGE